MSTKTATLYWGELEELVQVTVQFNVGETCAHYRLCAAAVRPDADIAGIGVRTIPEKDRFRITNVPDNRGIPHHSLCRFDLPHCRILLGTSSRYHPPNRR